MKKYKLKKDFPGSKIGDVWVKADNGFMSPEDRETIKMHEHLFKPFNDWFEDCKEPKKYWYIDAFGNIVQNEITKHYGDEYTDMTNAYESQKQIGNHFETPEEAEEAVEKLKALKRLEDKGFKVDLWDYDGGNYQERIRTGRILFRVKDYEENDEDLDLLFGGEE